MKKIAILMIVLIMASIGFLSGCTNTDRTLKGTWKDTYDEIWEFNDNTVYINSQSGGKSYGYSINGDKLYIPDWIGEENYYTMNWIDDETLELKVILGSSISKEILTRYYKDNNIWWEKKIQKQLTIIGIIVIFITVVLSRCNETGIGQINNDDLVANPENYLRKEVKVKEVIIGNLICDNSGLSFKIKLKKPLNG